MITLTKKQNEVFTFLKTFQEKNGYIPSLREIAQYFNVGTSAAQGYINSLVIKGVISKKKNLSRSILFKDESPTNRTISLPLLGTISAGYGIVVNEESEPEIVEVPADMVTKQNETYCLKVKGWSMKDDGVADGDTVVIQHQAYAENGETVVAILKGDYEEKATLKRYYHKGKYIELKPRNPNFSPIKVKLSEIEIRGKFKGLIRKDSETN